MRGRWVVVGAFILFLAAPTWAYQEGDVKDAGTIAGTVKFAGTPPAAKTLDATKDQEVCGKEPISEEGLVVGKEGGVQWAVVSLTDIQSGKKWDLPEAVMDQKGCVYRPHVLLTQVGKDLAALNSDGILHNIHTFPEKNPPLNRAQPKFLKKLVLKGSSFKTPETMNVKCDVHPWMNASVVVAAHPYYAVTDANGQFTLTNVPAGTYTLEVWQESLGKTSQKVTVKANEKATLEITLQKK